MTGQSSVQLLLQTYEIGHLRIRASSFQGLTDRLAEGAGFNRRPNDQELRRVNAWFLGQSPIEGRLRRDVLTDVPSITDNADHFVGQSRVESGVMVLRPKALAERCFAGPEPPGC